MEAFVLNLIATGVILVFAVAISITLFKSRKLFKTVLVILMVGALMLWIVGIIADGITAFQAHSGDRWQFFLRCQTARSYRYPISAEQDSTPPKEVKP